jgi:acetamidase/formamidase
MRRLPRSATTLFFDPEAEPLAEVASGERIVVETADSVCGLAKAEAPRACTSRRCWRGWATPAR